MTREPITVWLDVEVATDPVWEAAYARFETPAQERAKFRARLRRLGADAWDRKARVVELFCGRGNGLLALADLGFTRVEGVDLSRPLLSLCPATAKLYQGDCRRLRLPDASREVVIVHGGLHHLPDFPAGLAATLAEIHRVLVPGGRLALVEPWLTPFLRGVHGLCSRTLLRRFWGRLDALAAMIEGEGDVYFPWLAGPDAVTGLLDRCFIPERRQAAWGKLLYVGRKPESVAPAP